MNRRKSFLLLAATLAAGILLGHGAFFGHGYDATLMLADLAGLEAPLPDRRPNFERSEIGYTADGGWRDADLYTPQTAGGSGARAGLVLVPGSGWGRNWKWDTCTIGEGLPFRECTTARTHGYALEQMLMAIFNNGVIQQLLSSMRREHKYLQM